MKNFTWILLALVLTIGLLGMACVANAPQKDAKAQLMERLTKAQNVAWRGESDYYGNYLPVWKIYYWNKTNYRFDWSSLSGGSPLGRSNNGEEILELRDYIKDGQYIGCERYPGRWSCFDRGRQGSGVFIPNPSEIEHVSSEKIEYAGLQEVDGVNASCYRVDTSDTVRSRLPPTNKLASGDYGITYCFSPAGVMLRREEKTVGSNNRYGIPEAYTQRFDITHYSLNISQKDFDLPGPLVNSGAAPVSDSAGSNQIMAQTTLPTPYFDDYCPVEGWAILSVGESVKLGNWTARFADVSVAVGSDNRHPAILDVLDENGKMLEQVRVNPGESYTVRRESDGRSIVIKVNMTATGLTLSAKWIAIWGRASDCKDEMLNLETGQKMVPPIQRWLLRENDTMEIGGTRVQYAGTRTDSPIEGVHDYYAKLKIQNDSDAWNSAEIQDQKQTRLLTANGSIYQLVACEMSGITNIPNRPWMLAAYQPNDAYTPASGGICTPLDILKNEKTKRAIDPIPYEKWMPEAREGEGYAILNHGDSIRYGNLTLMFVGMLNRGVFNVSKVGDAAHAAHLLVYDNQGQVLFYDAIPQGGQVKLINPTSHSTYASLSLYEAAVGMSLSAEWVEVKIERQGWPVAVWNVYGNQPLHLSDGNGQIVERPLSLSEEAEVGYLNVSGASETEFGPLRVQATANAPACSDDGQCPAIWVLDENDNILIYGKANDHTQASFTYQGQPYTLKVAEAAAGANAYGAWVVFRLERADGSDPTTTEQIGNGTMNGQGMDSQIMRDYAAGSRAEPSRTLKTGNPLSLGHYTVLFDGTIRRDSAPYAFASGINNDHGLYGGRLQIFDEQKHKVFDGYMWEGTERLLALPNGLFQFRTYSISATNAISSRTIVLNITTLGEFSPHARLLFISEPEGWNNLSNGEQTAVQALQTRCRQTPCETNGPILKITQNTYWETDIPIQYRAIKLDITAPDGRTGELMMMPSTYVDWAAPDGKTYEIQVQEPAGSGRQSTLMLKVLQADEDTSYQGAECASWSSGPGTACLYLKGQRLTENYRPRSQDNITMDGLQITIPYGWSRNSVYVEVRNPDGPQLGGWVNLGQSIKVKSAASGKTYEVRLLATDQYRTLAAEEHEYGSDVFAATIGVRPAGGS